MFMVVRYKVLLIITTCHREAPLLSRHDASKCWPGAENYEGRDPGSEHQWSAVRVSDNNNHQTGPWWILFTNFWSGVIFSVLVSLTQIASQQTIIMTRGPGLTFIKIVFKILFCLRHQLAWRGQDQNNTRMLNADPNVFISSHLERCDVWWGQCLCLSELSSVPRLGWAINPGCTPGCRRAMSLLSPQMLRYSNCVHKLRHWTFISRGEKGKECKGFLVYSGLV